jgi:hypothetical protein
MVFALLKSEPSEHLLVRSALSSCSSRQQQPNQFFAKIDDQRRDPLRAKLHDVIFEEISLGTADWHALDALKISTPLLLQKLDRSVRRVVW